MRVVSSSSISVGVVLHVPTTDMLVHNTDWYMLMLACLLAGHSSSVHSTQGMGSRLESG